MSLQKTKLIAKPPPGHTVAEQEARDWQFRWMTAADFPVILRIEKQCFSESAWNNKELRHVLQSGRCLGGVCYSLISKDIAGYIIYRKDKQAIEIMRMAVDPEYRRQGIGTLLLDRLRFKLLKTRESIVADVPERMLLFQLFLRASGFKATQVLKGADPAEDWSYLMVQSL